jgi:hypothetical protein
MSIEVFFIFKEFLIKVITYNQIIKLNFEYLIFII